MDEQWIVICLEGKREIVLGVCGVLECWKLFECLVKWIKVIGYEEQSEDCDFLSEVLCIEWVRIKVFSCLESL